MVEQNTEAAADSLHGEHNDTSMVEEGAEPEPVAPWQQGEEAQQAEEHAGEDHGEQQDHDHGQQQQEPPGKSDVGTEEVDPLAGLGSVDDIAAAAMQAANLSAFFGNVDAGEDNEERGTKRSHGEMTKEQEEASVLEQFSTVAPDPAEETSKAVEEASLPAVSSFQNSFSQFQADPAPASSAVSGLQSGESIAAPVRDAPLTEAANPEPTPSVQSEQEAPVEEAGDPSAVSLIGFQDLQAVAQAAMGLDANGNPLPGNEESHRALAEAVKRLSVAQGITLPSTSSSNDAGGATSPSQEANDESNEGGPVKRFQCTQCERAFARAYNLNTHLATHDPDPSRSKPFPCPYPSCKADGGRSFSRKHDLQRHVASTHENEPEPGINGTGDENGSRQSGGLASLGLGTPGRKFRCDECGRAFVRRDALKRHQCTRIMESTSTPPRRVEAPDYYSNAAAGLSLYTSNTSTGQPPKPNAQSAAAGTASSVAGSSYDSDPFGPNGITYENLSKEVQDMAMQLVAQAQSYNEQQGQGPKVEPAQGQQQGQPQGQTGKVEPPKPAQPIAPVSQPTSTSQTQTTPVAASAPQPAPPTTELSQPRQNGEAAQTSQALRPEAAGPSEPMQVSQPVTEERAEGGNAADAKTTAGVKTESQDTGQSEAKAAPASALDASGSAPAPATVKVEQEEAPLYPAASSTATPNLVSAQ